MEIINKSFKEWKKSDLKKYIGLIEKSSLVPLQNWLTTTSNISPAEQEFLQEICQEAIENINYWNEMDLRQKFIALILWKVKFDNKKKEINSFTERKLSITIKNVIAEVSLYGMVDWLLAKGLQDPEHPFFFIHEYKKEQGTANDPLGQLLATMVVAQELNQVPPKPTLFNPTPSHFYKDIPIYGVYILGRFWFFVVLKDKEYAVSQPFVATKIEDLQAIFKILKAQKQLIYSYLEK